MRVWRFWIVVKVADGDDDNHSDRIVVRVADGDDDNHSDNHRRRNIKLMTEPPKEFRARAQLAQPKSAHCRGPAFGASELINL